LRRTAFGAPVVTDGGHYILDCHFKGIEDPQRLEMVLNNRPGILENGLFLGMADAVVVASPAGVRVLEREG
jgi:ribose 5-phosphate isomerase A